jgi:hypothetical protein
LTHPQWPVRRRCEQHDLHHHSAWPTHGTLTGFGETRTYTPAAGYEGFDSFTFQPYDTRVDSSLFGRVFIKVGSPEGWPCFAVASPNTYSATGPNYTFYTVWQSVVRLFWRRSDVSLEHSQVNTGGNLDAGQRKNQAHGQPQRFGIR